MAMADLLHPRLVLSLLVLSLVFVPLRALDDDGGTIAFSTLGRLSFNFDVYTVDLGSFEETRVSLGQSVSYNAQLVEGRWGSAVVDRLQREGHELQADASGALEFLVYVSEVDGSPQLYLDVPLSGSKKLGTKPIAVRGGDAGNGAPKAYLNDRPSMHGDTIVFVSTEEDVGKRVQGWNAVYSLNFRTSVTKRLTPSGVTDYSPALSPSGEWVAAVSNEGRGWKREIEALDLDLYVFRAEDGSQRRMVVRNAGWPAWADESIVYFHRLADDGWWSIFRVNVTSVHQDAERVTPPGVHAFTPAASTTGPWIAVATRRTSIRHIEIFSLETGTFFPITSRINPSTHHYQPFLSPTSTNKLGYHRCRGNDVDLETKEFRVELQQSPLPGVSVARVGGSFPVISPDGTRVAYVDSGDDSAGVSVMNLDGSQRRVAWSPGRAFGINWDPSGKTNTVFLSEGRPFASFKTTVRVAAIQNADSGTSSTKYLTKEGTRNNAFPSASPDGKYVVFRSSRSGQKNLYIMDAVDGEEKYLRRLTEGAWRDTMPAWSPDNQWIAFSSNRVHPTGERSYNLYLIRPDGTGLRLLLDTGPGGLAMHPHFSPDSQRVAFASNWAGVSAEPITFPHSYQPYGTIFVISVDGTNLTRITHNGYEDGTPTWGSLGLARADVSKEGVRTSCAFEDVWFFNNTGIDLMQPRRGQCQRRWGDYLQM